MGGLCKGLIVCLKATWPSTRSLPLPCPLHSFLWGVFLCIMLSQMHAACMFGPPPSEAGAGLLNGRTGSPAGPIHAGTNPETTKPPKAYCAVVPGCEPQTQHPNPKLIILAFMRA